MILGTTRCSAFSILSRARKSTIRLQLQPVKKIRLIFNQIQQFLISRNSKFFLSFPSTLLAQASQRSNIYADPRSLSYVPHIWICLVCQIFGGCSIDDRNAKLRTRFKFLSVLVVVGRPEWSSSAIFLRPSLNVLCHLPDCDLEIQSSLKASCCIWNVLAAFFPSYIQNLIMHHCSSEHFIALCYIVEKTLHPEARLNIRTVWSKLTTDCIGRPPQLPPMFIFRPVLTRCDR